jgi:hypothetical protein
VSEKYVICKADSSPILEFPTGIAIITVRAGRHYLATDAVVKQHPELFVPVRTDKPKAEAL